MCADYVSIESLAHNIGDKPMVLLVLSTIVVLCLLPGRCLQCSDSEEVICARYTMSQR